MNKEDPVYIKMGELCSNEVMNAWLHVKSKYTRTGTVAGEMLPDNVFDHYLKGEKMKASSLFPV